jgi:hypothetical protein
MLKIVNYLVKQVDTICLTAISSAVTQTAAATGGGTWSGASSDPLLDLMLAKATVIGPSTRATTRTPSWCPTPRTPASSPTPRSSRVWRANRIRTSPAPATS